MTDVNEKSIGKMGEKFAAEYIQRQNIEILENNFRVRGGEIDIIARDRSTIVFVEVKVRKSDFEGIPEESIDIKKQEKIRRVAEIYLSKMGWTESDVRFDVIVIKWDNKKQKWHARWIKKAF